MLGKAQKDKGMVGMIAKKLGLAVLSLVVVAAMTPMAALAADDATTAVIDAIAQLPDVSAVTEADRDAVTEAHKKFIRLTDEQEAQVTNASKLSSLLDKLGNKVLPSGTYDAATVTYTVYYSDGTTNSKEGAVEYVQSSPSPADRAMFRVVDAVVVSDGSSMTATITLSGIGQTHLLMDSNAGSAQSAEENAGGVDKIPGVIAGTKVVKSEGEQAYRFDIPLSTVDGVIPFASRSTNGSWYTRNLVFDSSNLTKRNEDVSPTVQTTVLPNAQVGKSYSVTLEATGHPETYTWALSSGSALPAGLSLDKSTGTISGTPTKSGSYTFAVTATNSAGTSAAKQLTLTVVGEDSIDLSSAVVEVDDMVYTGQELQPGPTVTLDGKTLSNGTDFTVEYANNVEVGAATVTVRGSGDYVGQATGSFNITPASIAAAIVTAPAQAYTGSAMEPAVTVKLGGIALVAGTDYTAKYADNVNAGTATVTVTGKANYAGTATGTFTVSPASISRAEVSCSPASFTHDGTAKQPAVTVKLGDKALKAGTDFTVEYANNVEVGKATATVTGQGNYAGTAKGTFQIVASSEPGPTPDSTPISIAGATVTAPAQAYTGSPLEPAVTVKLGGKTLVAGTDYTASYANNVKIGTATVTVTGAGDYTGTATGTFEITPAADVPWTRLAGDDRFGTMKAITLEGYESADTVLVATGIDFADALAAAGLSGVLDAPIVTTMPGELSAEAKDAITKLGAKNAIILGGTSAVSADVEKQLKGMGLTVERLAGDNRIDTAVRIWKRGGSEWGDTCILSKGWVAADALAAGSFAYADSAPLFLAMPDGTLTPDTAAAVKSFDHVVVLGGTGGDAAISDATAKSLGTSWMRVAGDTRYETATALATWASGNDDKAAFQPSVKLSWDDCAVAFAWNYPDALVGVNATGPKASVTLLASTDVDELTEGVADAVKQHAAEVSHGYVLGGTSVVSDAVKKLFETAAK